MTPPAAGGSAAAIRRGAHEAPVYVVHVGPPKTGSTALQRAIARHRAALAARGVLVPEGFDSSAGNPSHTGLWRALIDRDMETLAPRFAAWNESAAHTVLLSCELLAETPADALHRLRTLCGSHPVRVVWMLRRFSDLLLSSWFERLRHGSAQPLPDYVLEHLRNPMQSGTLNAGPRLEALAGVFGRDSLRLVSLSTLEDRGIDLFEHFAANFLDWADAPAGGRANPGEASPARAELLRVLNEFPWDAEAAPLSARLAAVDPSAFASIEAAMAPHLGTLRLGDALPGLRALNLALFDAWGSCRVPPMLASKLVEPRPLEASHVRPAYLLTPGIAEALTRLHRSLCT